MRARPETLELIEGYYASMDAGRFDEAAAYFVEDATFKIAHLPEIVGAETIDRVVRAGLANPNVQALVHEVRNAWEEPDDGTVIFEVLAHYTMSDGRSVDVPGVVIAEIADGRFRSQRIAADLSPVFAGGS